MNWAMSAFRALPQGMQTAYATLAARDAISRHQRRAAQLSVSIGRLWRGGRHQFARFLSPGIRCG